MPRSYGSLLGDSTFGPFFASNSLSNIGNWFQNVAAGIVVFDLTGSNTAVGAVSMVQFGAILLLTLYTGGLADRVNRRWLLFAGQATAAVGAGALAVAVFVVGIDGFSGPWPIYAATAMIGVGTAILLPSLQALVPALVEPDDLDRAITLNSLTFNAARSIGPVLAGVVVAVFGARWAFAINATTFVPLLVVLAFINPPGEVEPDPEESGPARDAVGWAWSNPTVVVLLAATLAVGWTSDPFSTLMPQLAQSFGHGETVVGVLVGAFGGGAALTVPVADVVRRRVGRGRTIGLGLGITAVGLGVMALSPVLAATLAGAAIAGSGFLLGVTSTNTELQRNLPEELRGRVMALWSIAFLGCRPLAALIDGVIADAASVHTAIGVAAAVAAIAGGALWKLAPDASDISN